MKRFAKLLLLVGLAVALVGCVATAPPGEASPETTVAVEEPAASAPAAVEPAAEATTAPSEEAAAEATSVLAALAPTPTSEAAVPTAPTDWSTVATGEGEYIILGNPAAPIRLVDYSDFM
jgi:protein-disulfide isomerase